MHRITLAFLSASALFLGSCSSSSNAGPVDVAAVDWTTGYWELSGQRPDTELRWDGSRIVFESSEVTEDGVSLRGYIAWEVEFQGATGSAHQHFKGEVFSDRRMLLETTGLITQARMPPGAKLCQAIAFATVGADGGSLEAGSYQPTGPDCDTELWTARHVRTQAARAADLPDALVLVLDEHGGVTITRGVRTSASRR